MQPAALCEIEVYYFTLGQENPVDGYDRDCHHFIISFQSVAPFLVVLPVMLIVTGAYNKLSVVCIVFIFMKAIKDSKLL